MRRHVPKGVKFTRAVLPASRGGGGGWDARGDAERIPIERSNLHVLYQRYQRYCTKGLCLGGGVGIRSRVRVEATAR